MAKVLIALAILVALGVLAVVIEALGIIFFGGDE